MKGDQGAYWVNIYHIDAEKEELDVEASIEYEATVEDAKFQAEESIQKQNREGGGSLLEEDEYYEIVDVNKAKRPWLEYTSDGVSDCQICGTAGGLGADKPEHLLIDRGSKPFMCTEAITVHIKLPVYGAVTRKRPTANAA